MVANEVPASGTEVSAGKPRGSFMFSRIAMILVSLQFLGSAIACGKEPTPGNPPRVLLAGGIDADGSLELVSYRTIYIGFTGESYNSRSVRKVALLEVKIVRAGGEAIELGAARKLLAGKETPVLASSWGSPLPASYRSLFSGDAMLFIFPREAPAWQEIQDPSRPLER